MPDLPVIVLDRKLGQELLRGQARATLYKGVAQDYRLPMWDIHVVTLDGT